MKVEPHDFWVSELKHVKKYYRYDNPNVQSAPPSLLNSQREPPHI